MASLTLRVLLYALVAMMSPLALGATVAVLKSEHGRINGAAFALAFVAAQALVTMLAFAFDAASLPDLEGGHQTFTSIVALAVGVMLLATAAYVQRHPRHHTDRPARPGARRMLARLERLSPPTALGVGALLGIGGPKRLGLTILAAATVSAGDVARVDELGLVIVYVLLATLLVWSPVLLAVVFGDRATAWMNDAQTWVYGHEQALVLYPSLVLGVVLVGNALIYLL
jgi:hypothetical protein